MKYAREIAPDCFKAIRKHSKRYSLLAEILEKKMGEIEENPYHYKPLSDDLAGERRVHIISSCILRYVIEERTKTVRYVAFKHHDHAYAVGLFW